ncbi:RNA polymerase sigma factor [Streptomyces sp. 549]|uniref:RNA polymerase sigma factor n=1 Tax=Streptomyces sp. 549 TaxID=3049076 RepID=UPI0024C38AB4|nr:RNA polymerase sigma factor [Streptomyces sp. 549]MDK1476727.1 RNA polymerase sigma factor [Streptomyces sp. 549]
MPEDDEAPVATGPVAQPELGDALLAVRAGEGDEEAFEVLVRRHSPVLISLGTRMLGSRADAEDAVQDAFVSAWRRLPEFRGDSAFLTWMYRIVTNRCLNLLRARRPTEQLDVLGEPSAPEYRSSPARAAETTAAVKDLTQALAQLSPEQRACWVLRELHGLGYREIAGVVGISEQAVRGRIFRVRRYLTEAMSAWR